MTKPWSYTTFPWNAGPFYIRRKGHPIGASMITHVAPEGVMVVTAKGTTGVPQFTKISWAELAATCEQYNGKPCGIRQG